MDHKYVKSNLLKTEVLVLFVLDQLLFNVIDAREFSVYWNVPSFMCQQQNLPIVNVTERYGILQNENDAFRGRAISILYDPGKFPALLENSSSKQYVTRNGGVPQRGNLNDHLYVFRKHLDELIPRETNAGLGVIDFESWRPVYRQNFGTLQPYKDLSVQIEKEAHPRWSQRRLEAEASDRFEEAARSFMASTLETAKQLRPNAKWGYYGLPYCFNGRNNNIEDCPREVQGENDDTRWLYEMSDVIYPSVYMTEQMPASDRVSMVRGRIREAIRLSQNVRAANKPKVLAYYRYCFTDSKKLISQKDVMDVMQAIKGTGADGVILWGSSYDLNTKKKCVKFYDYLENVLGPAVQSFQLRYVAQGV